MKKFIAKYVLYVYLNFIKDDDIVFYKKWVKPIIKTLIFFRIIYVYILAVLLFPIFLFGMILENDKTL